MGVWASLETEQKLVHSDGRLGGRCGPGSGPGRGFLEEQPARRARVCGIETFHYHLGVCLSTQTEEPLSGQEEMGPTDTSLGHIHVACGCSWGQGGRQESCTDQISLCRHAKEDCH